MTWTWAWDRGNFYFYGWLFFLLTKRNQTLSRRSIMLKIFTNIHIEMSRSSWDILGFIFELLLFDIKSENMCIHFLLHICCMFEVLILQDQHFIILLINEAIKCIIGRYTISSNLFEYLEPRLWMLVLRIDHSWITVYGDNWKYPHV